MSLLEKSIRLTSPDAIPAASSMPSSRHSSPSLTPVVDVAVGATMSVTMNSTASVPTVLSLAKNPLSNAGSVTTTSTSRRSPSTVSSDKPSLSPSLSSDLDDTGGSSAHALTDVDPQILEALRSKDRLYVLKLGELMEGLINDRRQRIDLTPSTTYQRLLVHRCSAYYGLRPESDSSTKGISVTYVVDSQIPSRRICDLVPAENKFQPAFKIMARHTGDRKSKPNSQAGSVAGEDNDSSDIEPSEAGSSSGAMKKWRTIEEREAAYNEARSRIFMGFEEKEKDKDISASSSTASLVSGSGSASGGARSVSEVDGDEMLDSPVTESERSVPVVKDKQRRSGSKRGSGNNSATSSSRSIRSSVPQFLGSGPSSSRESRAPSPSMAYGNHYDPTAMVSPPYENPYHSPYSGTSPGSEYPLHNPYAYHPAYPPPPNQTQQYYTPYPQYYPPYPYPPPHNHTSEPSAQSAPNGEFYGPHPSVPPPITYGHPPYGWPPNMPPPPGQIQPPMPPPPPPHHIHQAQSPQHGPNPLPSYPQPPSQQNEQHPQYQTPSPPNVYGYMQPPYPYPSQYYPPPHPQLPPPHGPQNAHQQPMYAGPRPTNGVEPLANMTDRGTNGQSNVYITGSMGGNSSNGSVSHSRASSRSSMGSGPVNGNKGRGQSIPPLTRGPWSYGPGAGPSGYQQYTNNVANDSVGPRLTNRRMSGNSMSSSGYGSRSSVGDEASSTASSSTSSSSRRTYTSTSSQHPLPARPDWAVGLKPQPTLASHARHHDHGNNRKVSPVSPPRSQSSNGNGRPHQQPVLESTDFPPLSTSERETRAPTVAGAWTNSSVIRSAVSPPKGLPANQSGTALVNHTSPPNIDGHDMNFRLEDTDRGFERPPPKGPTELFNPKLPRKSQTPGSHQDERLPEVKNDHEQIQSMLATQTAGLSLTEWVENVAPSPPDS